MTDRTQKPRSGKGQMPTTDALDHADGDKPSGRVRFDERGNSVWEWETEESGEYSFDVNTQSKKKLEMLELELDEKDERGKIDRPETRAASSVKTGFNPYDRGGVASQSATPARGGEEPSAPGSRKPIKDLRRYNEWMKLKQRMAEKKEDE